MEVENGRLNSIFTLEFRLRGAAVEPIPPPPPRLPPTPALSLHLCLPTFWFCSTVLMRPPTLCPSPPNPAVKRPLDVHQTPSVFVSSKMNRFLKNESGSSPHEEDTALATVYVDTLC